MDILDRIEADVAAGGAISEADFEALRAIEERIADIEEKLQGADAAPRERARAPASGPALAIVVGHTRRRPGARAAAPISAHEYAWNSDLAQRIGRAARSRHVEHEVFYRDRVGISGAYADVEAWGAARVIELHFNAFNGRAHGTETLYCSAAHRGAKAWAEAVQEAQIEALGLRRRPVHDRKPGERGYGSVSALKVPIALIEPFFGDHTGDAATAEAKKDDLAEALAEAAAHALKSV